MSHPWLSTEDTKKHIIEDIDRFENDIQDYEYEFNDDFLEAFFRITFTLKEMVRHTTVRDATK